MPRWLRLMGVPVVFVTSIRSSLLPWEKIITENGTARKEKADVFSHGKSQKALDNNKRKENSFKARHAFLLAFLTLLIVLKVLGIFLFTSGFLLTRLVLDSKSECSIPPIEPARPAPKSPDKGCWHSKAFNKAVVIIIDALRYDFTVPFQATADYEAPRYFHDGFPLLYDLAATQPENAVLLPFIADPPTTTLQRLKGLTTGTLPTFIEAGSNFAGTAIDEDNLVAQLLKAGKNVVQLGDNTWHSLFPGYFDSELTKPFDSFNVWDLHTVDNGVTSNLMPLLQPANNSRWDVIFGHYLGVDHAGHRYGPDHIEMKTKLQQMNDVFTEVVKLIDDKTLLVVMGDHGMDVKGDHGGESDDEVQAALWLYSKSKMFGRVSKDTSLPPATAKERPVNQIDLVPTLALLLGLPIPFNNLGLPIKEVFIGPKDNDFQNLASANALTAAQIRLYQNAYAAIRKPDALAMSEPDQTYNDALDLWTSRSLTVTWSSLAQKFSNYQASNLRVCKDLWARFDLTSMVQGIAILMLTFAISVHFARGVSGDLTNLARPYFIRGLSGLAVGALVGMFSGLAIPSLGFMRTIVFSSALLSDLTLLAQISFFQQLTNSLVPASIWSSACLFFTLLTAVGFGSNSYTIWEDEMTLFFLASFLLLALSSLFRLPSPSDRRAALAHIFIVFTSLRLASLSRLCRDEQNPNCRSTFYASSTTTTSAPWQILLSWSVALTLPQTIKSFYQRTQSYHGSAPFWVGFAFQAQLFLVSCYWTLDAADDGKWLVGSRISGLDLKSVRMYVAQFVCMIAAGAGCATFAWMAPCFVVEKLEGPDTGDARPQLVVHGTANLYGSHYAILPLTVVLVPILLVQKPMGQFAVALTVLALLSSLELLVLLQKVPRTQSRHPKHGFSPQSTDTPLDQKQQLAADLASARPPSSATTTLTTVFFPVFCAFVAHFVFFKTGHQAALASIQWDSALVALQEIRYPWSPILVALNTFSGQILGGMMAIAGVLWGRVYRFTSPGLASTSGRTRDDGKGQKDSRDEGRRELLSQCARAVLTHGLAYEALNLASTVLTAHLRRHLMLYRVFMPRWALSVVGAGVAEMVAVWLGLGWGVGIVVRAVAGVFGW